MSQTILHRLVSNMFTSTGQVHKYNTRSSSSGNFYRVHTLDLTIIRTSLLALPFGAKLWNSIPANLKKIPERTFKMKIHNLLFINLQNPDS